MDTPKPAKRDEPAKTARPAPERLAVFITRKPTTCEECGHELSSGAFIRVEASKALCLSCADLDHLEYLPAGDTALTRRASKASPLMAVVLKWSPARKRYERQGVLASPAAIRKAEEECLADEDLRARQRNGAVQRRAVANEAFVAGFAKAIRNQFPSCPADEEMAIATHACVVSSGRVGRTQAARDLSPDAVKLAVIAHIRHVHTDYDLRLSRHGDRQLARDDVRDEVGRILSLWQRPP